MESIELDLVIVLFFLRDGVAKASNGVLVPDMPTEFLRPWAPGFLGLSNNSGISELKVYGVSGDISGLGKAATTISVETSEPEESLDETRVLVLVSPDLKVRIERQRYLLFNMAA